MTKIYLCLISQGTSAQPSPILFGLDIVWPRAMQMPTRVGKEALLKGPGQQDAAKWKYQRNSARSSHFSPKKPKIHTF